MGAEILTLGCRLNISESEALHAMLGAADDLIVVNSCAVTAEAVRQTRQTIRRAHRRRPDARIVVTGCAAEVERDMLIAMPEVSALVPNAAKRDRAMWPGATTPLPAPVAERRTRGFVEVQTGCDHACTFCVIPQGRGPSRSRTIDAVIADIEAHLAAGAGEIVLTGVDVTAWGADLPAQPRLGVLVAAILDRAPALSRLRLSSLDGVEIDDLLLELIGGEARIMPHLHLSLQSGDDMVLTRMKRRHRRADAAQLVERLRARRPDLSIGADIIAGFPTETDAMHAANRSIIADLGIVHGHIFPYSPRPGTPAARMPQVPPAIVRQRAAELREATAAQRTRWQASLIGTAQSVLAERDGTGHAQNFARIRLPAGTVPGTILPITPTRIEEGLLA